MKRVRGGASHACPSCGGVTKVRTTWRTGDKVTRDRECVKCKHRYYTTERFFGWQGDAAMSRAGSELKLRRVK
jgi:Zn ribbon nucleic-acid-binding protein